MCRFHKARYNVLTASHHSITALTCILGTFDLEPEDERGSLVRHFVGIAKIFSRPLEQARIGFDRNEAEAMREEFVVKDGSVVVDENLLDRDRRNLRDQYSPERVGDTV